MAVAKRAPSKTTGPQRWHLAHSTRRAGARCRRSDSAGPRARAGPPRATRSSCPGAQRGWAAARAPRPDSAYAHVMPSNQSKPAADGWGPFIFFQLNIRLRSTRLQVARRARARVHAAAAPRRARRQSRVGTPSSARAGRRARPPRRCCRRSRTSSPSAPLALPRRRAARSSPRGSCASRCGPSASTVRAAAGRRAAWRGSRSRGLGGTATLRQCRAGWPCAWSARWRSSCETCSPAGRTRARPRQSSALCGSARAVVRALAPVLARRAVVQQLLARAPDDVDVVPVGLVPPQQALGRGHVRAVLAVPSPRVLGDLGRRRRDDGRDSAVVARDQLRVLRRADAAAAGHRALASQRSQSASVKDATATRVRRGILKTNPQPARRAARSALAHNPSTTAAGPPARAAATPPRAAATPLGDAVRRQPLFPHLLLDLLDEPAAAAEALRRVLGLAIPLLSASKWPGQAGEVGDAHPVGAAGPLLLVRVGVGAHRRVAAPSRKGEHRRVLGVHQLVSCAATLRTDALPGKS